MFLSLCAAHATKLWDRIGDRIKIALEKNDCARWLPLVPLGRIFLRFRRSLLDRLCRHTGV